MQPDPDFLNDLAKRLAANLPASLQQARVDIERNFRSVLEAGLRRMDLVSREEFDTQSALLKRTRERLEELSVRADRLERQGSTGNKKPES
ncbi:MAG: accessory factor UbiK family protein [Gammaproteobacteria bacterium]